MLGEEGGPLVGGVEYQLVLWLEGRQEVLWFEPEEERRFGVLRLVGLAVSGKGDGSGNGVCKDVSKLTNLS